MMSLLELLCLYVLEFIGCLGCKMDFFYLYLLLVGVVCCLLIDVVVVDIVDFVCSFVCVFDDNGKVVGLWVFDFDDV